MEQSLAYTVLSVKRIIIIKKISPWMYSKNTDLSIGSMYSSIFPKRVILISSTRRPSVAFITKISAIKYISININKPLSKGFIVMSCLRSFIRVKRKLIFLLVAHYIQQKRYESPQQHSWHSW